MQIIIQIIETQWTKASRGAPHSDRRNKVPQITRIPEVDANSSTLLHHVVHYEHDNFAAHELVRLEPFTSHDSTKHRIEIYKTFEDQKIDFFGAPNSPTSGHPLTSIPIAAHAWVQIIANWRLSEESTWSYRRYVYNIYYGRKQAANQILMNEAPSTRFNCEKHLW